MEAAKEQFGIEITKLLKQRKLTQRGLAAHLGVSPAAVCYFLKNQLQPSAVQFDGIMEYLQADASQITLLRKLWTATQKEEPRETNDEPNLFAIRCAKDLTIEEVSAATGISRKRLLVLENKAGVLPTPEEAAVLKEFYGPSPDLSSLDDGETKLLGVAEEFSDEMKRSEKILPVFSIDILSRAAKAGTLEKFLGGLPFNNRLVSLSQHNVLRAQALLICKAEEIHYGFQGIIELILAEYDPDSTDSLHLGRGSRGGFTLWQKMRRSWKYCGSETPAPRMINSWSLPVLEMRFVAAPRITPPNRKK